MGDRKAPYERTDDLASATGAPETTEHARVWRVPVIRYIELRLTAGGSFGEPETTGPNTTK